MSNWDIVQDMFIHVGCQVENDGRRNKNVIYTRNVKFSLRTIVRALLNISLQRRTLPKDGLFQLSCFSTGI